MARSNRALVLFLRDGRHGLGDCVDWEKVEERHLRDPGTTDAILERCERYRAALERIAAIKNKDFGPDWEEIEEAREIANGALGRLK